MADGLFGLHWSELRDELLIDTRPPTPLPNPPTHPFPVPKKSYMASADVKQNEKKETVVLHAINVLHANHINVRDTVYYGAHFHK